MSDNNQSILHQPASVWVLTFACTVSYMGIGLVDPILPTIASAMKATPGQTELLFTSYLFVTAFVMYFSAWASHMLGTKKTLVYGVAIIVLFAALCSLSSSVGAIIGFRAGWGLGNALYVSTALAAIVASTAHPSHAILFYEAALGLGFAFGPLVGGLLGEVSWRGPFAGTAVLMGLALIALVIFFKDSNDAERIPIKPFDGIKGAFHRDMRWLGLGALFYNFAFMMMLTYAPFPVKSAASMAGKDFTPIDLGLVFFGWGIALAISSVFIAPRLSQSYGLRRVTLISIGLVVVLHALVALLQHNLVLEIIAVILSGAVLGTVNTLLTTVSMMGVTLPKPVASSAYSGTRFIGSALAPTVVGPLSGLGEIAPMWAAAISAAFAVLFLSISFKQKTA